MSFAMGRPDTLGADLYHNRRFPMIGPEPLESLPVSEHLEPPQVAIIKSMVDLSRITRNICQGIYLPETITPRAVALAYQLEQDLDKWILTLPEAIRPRVPTEQPLSLKSARDPQWAKRQRLVLGIREHAPRARLTDLTFCFQGIITSGFSRLHLCCSHPRQTSETPYRACEKLSKNAWTRPGRRLRRFMLHISITTSFIHGKRLRCGYHDKTSSDR